MEEVDLGLDVAAAGFATDSLCNVFCRSSVTPVEHNQPGSCLVPFGFHFGSHPHQSTLEGPRPRPPDPAGSTLHFNFLSSVSPLLFGLDCTDARNRPQWG